MKIETRIEDSKATLTLGGKLTVNTSPELTAAVDQLPRTVFDLDIDMKEVSYVASAGLRVLVAADKLAVKRGGTMRLLYPCEEVMEVFEMTGLNEVFEIVAE